MRTKTLLLTAALGAAGIASSMAQVYSVNAVGYVNTVIQPGFNLIANPLIANPTTLADLLPTVPDSTSYIGFNPGSGFVIRQYIDGLGWDPDGSPSLNVGDGFFLNNVSGAAFTVTFVGEVSQGALSRSLQAGFQIISSKVPQTGLISTDLGFPGQDSDSVYIFQNDGPGGQPDGYVIRQFIDGLGWDPDEPTLEVGKSMWLNSQGAHAPWTRNFTVN